MPLKTELYQQAKELGIKNYSYMNKQQLQDAIVVHLSVEWFNNLHVDEKITIHDDDLNMDIEVTSL